ncbi:MAG: CPBP family intramembrane metalloprotease [bacterium]|nr:CPBP family intramembrane metalloprotease [bacterium]
MGRGESEPNAQRNPLAPNPFSPATTALFAAAWLLVMLQGWGARIGSDPTTWLYDPAATAARIVNRDLELAEANEIAGAGQELRRALYGSLDGVLGASISVQRDATAVVAMRVESGEETPAQLAQANARLSVLLAEAGEFGEAFEIAGRTLDAATEGAILAVYATNPSDTNPKAQAEPQRDALPLAILAEAGLEDWLLERATIRLLEREAEDRSALAVSHRIEERGARWQHRSDLLTAANLLLIAGGILMLLAIARGSARQEWAMPLAVPWSAALGFAVLVRGDFWNRFYFGGLAQLADTLSYPEWLGPFYTWGTLLASLPLLWLVYRYLLAPSPGPLLEPLGLHPGTLRLRRIVPITAAALGIDLLGTTALAWGSFGLGFEGHWAEGFDETLLWGSTREVVETCINYLLWTPVFEELMFRGLLFSTLRIRFGAFSAAVLSAVCFSLLHFYSLPGFLMTFWSGLVWAFAFERANSLLPGIVAHALYNLLFVLGILLVYR